MPQIAAFRGVRYDVGHVGSLEGVVSPSPILIDATLQKELYERHPANVVRLIRNREELGDEPDAAHERAARLFRNWQREGALQREPDPALYVYHQSLDDGEIMRRGFICLMRIDGSDVEVSDRQVEDEVVADRLKLLRSCEANLSSVVGVFSSLQSETQELLDQSVVNVAPIETKANGITHRVWPVTKIEQINQATTLAAEMRVAIVAGIEEYVAAKQWLAESNDANEQDRRSKVMVCMFESDVFDPLDVASLQDVPNHDMLCGLVFRSHHAK